jgi:hypothetical protein
LNGPPLTRLVLTEAAIDALSIAAIESLRRDTLYAATGGGMGPGTIAALEALLVNIAMLSPLQRHGRQWTGRPLCRPAPISRGKIRHHVRAASATNRRRGLERCPARPIGSGRPEVEGTLSVGNDLVDPIAAAVRYGYLDTSAGRDLTALRSKAGCDGFQRGLVPPDRTTRAFRAAGALAIAVRRWLARSLVTSPSLLRY